MKALMQPLEAVAGYEDLKKQIRKNTGIIEVSGCLDAQKAHLAAGLSEGCGTVLMIAENELKARELMEDCRLYGRQILYYPRRDLIFYQADVSGNLLTRQRMQVYKTLLEQENSGPDGMSGQSAPVTVVTSAGGCMEYLLPVRVLRKQFLRISSGGTIDLQELTERLSAIGYERCGEVEASGQFAVRGSIIDIFSLTEEYPYRIELWGDDVDSIRVFDPESQRSVETVEEIMICPASEEPGRPDDPEEEGAYFRQFTDSFLDYLPAGTRIFLDEPARILESAKAAAAEYREAMRHRLEQEKILPGAADRMLTPEQLLYELNRRNCTALSLMQIRKTDFEVTGEYAVTVRAAGSYNNQFPMLVDDLKKWKKRGYRSILVSASRTRGMRLAANLTDEGIPAFYSEDADRVLDAGEIMVIHGSMRRGFEYPLQKFVLITETDIFGTTRRKKHVRKNENAGDRIRSFQELSVGDYVVHESHGLGIYRGIEKVEVDHTLRDFIKIEYEGGSNLYVIATSLDALQKYSGSEGRKPKINRLGGREWQKTRTRVHGAVQNIARELVALYAARQGETGYKYGPDTIWQREFEEMFPFEETEDQLAAIEDTKKDMESGKIMDRLICGDVGYGKTEIAIRAAFKAVQENRQVVLLCPTTILAQQHYNTFRERMSQFPVRVDMLSRFRTPAQQKKTIEDTRRGQVDILIGTHRVLSKDIVFKELGLLIIDEEQRFGVTHKERIKQMKKNVDVLTLSATPIPRTLHMSLIGIRDMSVLEEPPIDRMPIQTYVMEYDEELVREAISRELARDGQVYYVYNRVSNIDEVAARIQALVPEANVAYAHGQMKERELEKIMVGFINGEIDVLVSTTIIETGMDISNVNTLIVCDADRMGLSQLYQLRGRVGRSSRNAYAFLMYRRNKLLREEAEKRLHAIREFTDLGSGVRIAMRDLEIRGAGNLLGAEQHGHMEAVGYDLYCKMLGEAVREAKGEKPRADFETVIDLTVSAYIPGSYIPDEGQKLEIYKRIAGLESREEAEDMTDELIDRFGEPPAAVQNLVSAALIKAMAHSCWVTEIRQNGTEIRIGLYERAMIDPQKIPGLLEEERYRNKLRFHMGEKPYFTYDLSRVGRDADTVLRVMTELAEDMQGICLT